MNKTGRWIIGRIVFAIGFSVAIILFGCSPQRRHAAQVINRTTPGAGITEITFARSSCYGYCPGYQVTFEKDGCAFYDGYGYVPWIGHYIGYVPPGKFDYLAQLIDERGFFSMQHKYGNFDILDNSHYGLSVVRNGLQKSVEVSEDFSYAGPMRIVELGYVIDGTIFKTLWFGKGSKPPYAGRAPQRPPMDCPWSRNGPDPFAPNLKHSP
jgi:hypothetical protein